MNREFITVKRFLLILAIVSFGLLWAGSGTVLAHTPHDDVQDLEVSPDFASDQTAYAIVRGNFFRTIDGGAYWQREVRGLDNKEALVALTLSPAEKSTLYAGSRSGGIFKSLDGGDSWAAASSGLDLDEVLLLEAAPSSADVVVVVDARGRLYRTTDGARSWQPVEGAPFDGRQLTAVAFPDAAPEQLFAGDADGLIYRSSDQGQTWQQCCAIEGAGAISAITFSDRFDTDGILFAGTSEGRVFKSSDGGRTFVASDEGLQGREVTDLMASPDFNDDNLVYALTAHGGVFRSADAGVNWQPSGEGTWRNNQSLEYGRPSFSAIRATSSFAEDDTLFLGTFVGVFRSTDRGSLWQKTITLPMEIVAGAAIANTGSGSNTVGITHYIGELLINDGAHTTQVLFNKGLPQLSLLEEWLTPLIRAVRPRVDVDRLLEQPFRLLDVAFSPDYAQDQTLFVTVVNHLLVSEDGGQSWSATPLYGDLFGFSTLLEAEENAFPYIIALSPDFAEDDTLFLGLQEGLILRSQDRGKSLEPLGRLSGDYLNALVLSPDFPRDQTMFAANDADGIFRSVDGGQTWELVVTAGQGAAEGMAGHKHLALSPEFATDQFLLAGTNVGLLQSTDAGDTWEQARCDVCGPDNVVAAVGISPDFAQDQTVFLSIKGKGLFRSEDGGQNFVEAAESLLDSGVIISNLDDTPPTSGNLKLSPAFGEDQTLLGFSDIALVRSNDGGESWENLAYLHEQIDETYGRNLLYGRFLLFPLLLVTPIVVLIGVALLAVEYFRRRAR